MLNKKQNADEIGYNRHYLPGIGHFGQHQVREYYQDKRIGRGDRDRVNQEHAGARIVVAEKSCKVERGAQQMSRCRGDSAGGG